MREIEILVPRNAHVLKLVETEGTVRVYSKRRNTDFFTEVPDGIFIKTTDSPIIRPSSVTA